MQVTKVDDVVSFLSSQSRFSDAWLTPGRCQFNRVLAMFQTLLELYIYMISYNNILEMCTRVPYCVTTVLSATPPVNAAA